MTTASSKYKRTQAEEEFQLQTAILITDYMALSVKKGVGWKKKEKRESGRTSKKMRKVARI